MLATARWRQLRTSNLEAATVSKTCELQKSGTADAAEATSNAYKAEVQNSRVLDLYAKGEARLQRQWESSFDRLRKLQKSRISKPNPDEPSFQQTNHLTP